MEKVGSNVALTLPPYRPGCAAIRTRREAAMLAAYAANGRANPTDIAQMPGGAYNAKHQTRGGAVWQLVGLITRRSQVQILSPQPKEFSS